VRLIIEIRACCASNDEADEADEDDEDVEAVEVDDGARSF
jgi:hypothetical protein